MELADLRIFRAVVERGRHPARPRASCTACRRASPRASSGSRPRSACSCSIATAAPAPVAGRRTAARLRREAAAPLRRGASALAGWPPAGLLRLGALESTTASRLPRCWPPTTRPIPSAHRADDRHQRRADGGGRSTGASTRPSSPSAGGRRALAPPLFSERLVLITSRGHRPVRGRRTSPAIGHRLPERLRLSPRLYRWLGDTQRGDDARPRPRLVPRDRRLRRLGHRHRARARVGAAIARGEGARHRLPKVYARSRRR